MNIEKIPAYELLKKEELGDIHSMGYLLCHRKSGARVMVIENEDENKVFNIAFRTPPGDSTGVAHILEHSVLCGSRHFPLKDPFVELVKGSLNTFLNAMTFPDKTMYPVASCNDKDFHNLMHVYLDAVFYPNIYEHEEIFRQEGWTYQADSVDGPLTYNGVVYNEMKGAFSSPDEVLERKVMDALFPDTTYGVESGGDPQVIPSLTYEQFLDFHRQYYHPSNSYIYLYGKIDMEEELAFMDEEYLSAYTVREIHSQIPIQKAFDEPRKMEMYYPILEHESEKDNTYLTYNVAVGEASDVKLSVAFQALEFALMGAPGAPLKQALLDAGIGKDVYGSYDDGIRQPSFHIVAKGANEEDQECFLKIIQETLDKIAQEGVNEKSLRAGIHSMEFRFREADYASYPKGLMYGMDVFATWLYDENQPFDRLKLLSIFKELGDLIGSGYYEEIIRTYLLDNSHKAYLMLKPKKGMAAEQEESQRKILEAYKAEIGEEGIAQIVRRTQELKAYQEREESQEALACIPMLGREDIRRDVGQLYNEERWVEDSLLLYHPVETSGIAYLNLYYDLARIPQELLPYAGLLKSVLGYVDTEHYTYSELYNEIGANTGGIYWGIEFFPSVRSSREFRAFVGVRSKALNDKVSFVYDMMKEIQFSSSFADDKRLREIISRMKSRLQSAILANGHGTALQRAMSYSSPMAWMQELTFNGIEYYKFLEDLDAHFEERVAQLKNKLRQVMDMLFTSDNLSVSFTGDEETCKVVEEETKKLKEVLGRQEMAADAPRGTAPYHNEGFMTAGQVQYVAQVGNFVEKGLPYTGALNVLQVILSYDYLWANVRVQGGAYGCMSGFKRNGEGYFVSYRDPHLKNTLQVYKGIVEYLRDFQADERELTKYIIGTISNLDVPKTPKMKGTAGTAAYYMGVTIEQLQQERSQVLDATVEDIRRLADYVEAILETGDICVIGAEEKIHQAEELFCETKPLVE